MLKLTKKTDYGLMAICHIASNQGERVISAKEISEEYHIPSELLAKILQRLAKKGLIVSHNGPKGGYLLAKGVEEITVNQVIRAIEGPIGITDCYHEERPQCDHMDLCTIRTPMKKVQQTVMDALDRMTLKEVSEGLNPYGKFASFEETDKSHPLTSEEEDKAVAAGKG